MFSSYLHQFEELEKSLIDSKKAVNVQLQEVWCREYQVLPQRTHPHMNMDGASGFILSGIKVSSSF